MHRKQQAGVLILQHQTYDFGITVEEAGRLATFGIQVSKVPKPEWLHDWIAQESEAKPNNTLIQTSTVIIARAGKDYGKMSLVLASFSFGYY